MSKKILSISLGFVAVLAFAFVGAPQKASANGYSGSCNTNCYYPRPYYYQYQYPTANCACYTNTGYYPSGTGYYPTTAGYYSGYQSGYVGWGNQYSYQYQQPQQPTNNQPGWYPYGYNNSRGTGVYWR